MKRLLILLCLASTAQAQLTVTAIPTFENVGYYVPYADSTGVVCKVYYKHADSSTWKQAYQPYFATQHATDGDSTEFRGSVVGLTSSTTYDIWAVILTGADTTAQGDTTFTTWDETPTILRTHNLSDLYSSGTWTIADTTGTDGGWIRILGDDSTVIAGGAASYGMIVSNCSYVIFENVHVTGGISRGITVSGSDHLRFINCDISAWGEVPAYLGAGGYYNSDSALIQLDYGILFQTTDYSVIERCRIHDFSGNASTHVGGRLPGGATGIAIMSSKSVVIRYNDILGSETHWYEDGIKTMEDNVGGVPCEGYYKDSDVYGNLFSFANGDGVECEGEGLNVRVYDNLATHCFSPMSDAPSTDGPVYFFRNVIIQAGDSVYFSNPAIKLGGGTSLSTGRAFWFHNTAIGRSSVFTGVGAGEDGSGVKEKFLAMTRNNIFWAIGSSVTWAIDDIYEYNGNSSVNDFDYDMLRVAIRAKAGSEAHGTYSAPTWVDSSARRFGLQSGSKGIDSGVVLLNFSDGYAGNAPDQGAFEYGSNDMIPYRPINVTSDKYRATGTSAGSTVTLTSTTLDSTLQFTVEKDVEATWLTITPSSGEIASSSSQAFTFESTDSTQRAIALIRFDNGYSIPILADGLFGDVGGTPTITVTGTLNDFGEVEVGSSSASQNYTVEGTDLTDNLYIDATTNFQISDDNNYWSAGFYLAPSGGTVNTTTIYVRFTPVSTGVKSENIPNFSTDATTRNVAISGTGTIPKEPGTPTITVTGTLSDFGSVDIGSVSASQTYTVSGTDLTGDLECTPPTNFDFSLDNDFWSAGFSLTPTGGTVSATTIYVRFQPLSTGVKSENIHHASTGATAQDLAVSGTGTAPEPPAPTGKRLWKRR